MNERGSDSETDRERARDNDDCGTKVAGYGSVIACCRSQLSASTKTKQKLKLYADIGSSSSDVGVGSAVILSNYRAEGYINFVTIKSSLYNHIQLFICLSVYVRRERSLIEREISEI